MNKIKSSLNLQSLTKKISLAYLEELRAIELIDNSKEEKKDLEKKLELKRLKRSNCLYSYRS